ncbi:MAG: N-acetyltransferase [Woeseiaceae bacterium]|nr:N-acetyltransferase [Woeseiaceae bacterium]
MVLRDARRDDVAAMSRLASGAFVDAYGDSSPEDDLRTHVETYFGESAIASELDSAGVRYLLASAPEGLAGLVKLRNSKVPELVPATAAVEVQQLYVGTDFQRRGVGHTLMGGAVQAARDLAVAGIWLSVWKEADWATSFYRKFGFRSLGEIDFWLADTHYVDYLMWYEFD